MGRCYDENGVEDIEYRGPQRNSRGLVLLRLNYFADSSDDDTVGCSALLNCGAATTGEVRNSPGRYSYS